ncbi:MAG: KOW domain-containing RNA-binding protein [Bacillota bacterium]|nr:KOW domain-containing RNA-binding protein [Bacillota bacterium]
MRPPADGPGPRPGAYCRSLAGSDRGRLYLIRELVPGGHGTGNYLYLVDGSRHPWLRPKRKNLRHVRILSEELDPDLWAWCLREKDTKQIDGRLRRRLEEQEKDFMKNEERGS